MDFKDFSEELQKAMLKTLRSLSSKGAMKLLGEDFVKDLKKSLRLGRAAKENLESAKTLKRLSKPYKDHRRRLKGKGLLHNDTTASKSNLTQTGEMIDDINSVPRKRSVTVGFKSRSSRDKAKWNTDSGRPFMNVTKGQFKRIVKKLNKRVSKLLKQNLK